MIEVLIILVLLLATVYYVIAPLFQESASCHRSQAEDMNNSERYQQIGDELAEIEFELKAGKLPEEDYLNLRDALQAERELLD